MYFRLWLTFFILPATYIILRGIYRNSCRSVNQWVECSHIWAALHCNCLCGQSSEAESESCYFPTGAVWGCDSLLWQNTVLSTCSLSHPHQTNVGTCWNCPVIDVGCGLTWPWFAGANIDMLISYFFFYRFKANISTTDNRSIAKRTPALSF